MDVTQTLRPYAAKILDFSQYSPTAHDAYELRLPVGTVTLYRSSNGSSHNGSLVEAFCSFAPDSGPGGTPPTYSLRHSDGRRVGIPFDFVVRNDDDRFRHAAEIFTYHLRQCLDSPSSGISFTSP